MGNQATREGITNFSLDSLILDSILSELPNETVSLATERIKTLKINDLKIFADKIFEKAIVNHFCSKKYAELARKLCDSIPPDQFITPAGVEVNWNLNDFINRKAQNYFEILKAFNEDGIPLTHDKCYGISIFIGNLYNVGLITLERIFLWVSHEGYSCDKEVRKAILTTIKDKVIASASDPFEAGDEVYLWELIDLIEKQGMTLRINTAQPKIRIEADSTSSQSASSSQPKSSQQPATSSQSATPQTSSVPQPATSSGTTNISRKPANLPNEFENYLKNLNNNRAPQFDIKLLKNCSDADRKLCANKFFRLALNEPTKSNDLAQVARGILMLHMTNKKTFINFLTELCEEKLKKFPKPNQVVNWVEIEAFGIILGELYNVEVIKIFLMNTWLNNTKLMADENDLALKMLFKVVKIIHNKMQTKDQKTLAIFLKYFEEYKNKGRVPAAYATWLESVLRVGIMRRDRSRSHSAVSTSSQISQASSLQSEPSSSSTGAIRKQIMTVQENPQTLEVCEKFRLFLTKMHQTKPIDFELHLDTASDEALRGCALLLVENTMLPHMNVNKIVHITKQGIAPRLKFDDRKKIFYANFTLYLYAEMDKCLKPNRPASSDWKKAEVLGTVLSKFYIENLLENTIIKAWLTKLEFMSRLGFEEAFRIFRTSFASIRGKFQQERHAEFLNFEKIYNVKELPKQAAVAEEQPSRQNNTPNTSNEMRDFDFMLNNLQSVTYVKVIQELEKLKIDSHEKMKALVFIFFDVYSKHNGNPTYAFLATKIHKSLPLPIYSFKNTLESMVINEFNSSVDKLRTTTDKAAVERNVRCVAELYNVGWMNQTVILNCFKKLAVDNFKTQHHIQCFRNMLKNVSLQMAYTGDGYNEDFKNFNMILTDKICSNNSDAFNYMVCTDTIAMLENVWKISKMTTANCIDEEIFEEILDKLTNENINMSAYGVKLLNVGSEESLQKISHCFVKHCLLYPEKIPLMVKLLDEIKGFGTEMFAGDAMTIQQKVIECLKIDENAKQSEVMILLKIQAELYNSHITDMDTILPCLMDILNPSLDVNIDCFEYLVRSVGPKMDSENPQLLNNYLSVFPNKKFNSVYEKLLKIRKNDWIDEENSFDFSLNDMSMAEQLLKDLKDNEIASKMQRVRNQVLATEETINDFLFILFKCNLENNNFAAKSTRICKLIIAGESTTGIESKFILLLNEYMRCRNVAFLSKVACDKSSAFNDKLSNVIFLISELFSASIIDEKTLSLWLVPSLTSRMSYTQISKLCLLIGSKIDDSESVHLKARLMNLEAVMNEKLLESCDEMKDSLYELNISLDDK